jgi:hypothetical protein
MEAPRSFKIQIQEKMDLPRKKNDQPFSSPTGPFLLYSFHSAPA